MIFQYYENLEDKTKKYMETLINEIVPQLTVGELQIYLDDIAYHPLKDAKKSQKFSGFIEIGEDFESKGDISKLKSNDLKLMYQIFISREKYDEIQDFTYCCITYSWDSFECLC